MAASTASAPYGQRLLPHIIDDIASKDPQQKILLTARSSDLKDGWAPLTFNFWIYHGRVDNVIVFSGGKKLNPITIEETIQGHPSVKGALAIGSNKFQAGLLLEPVKHTEDEDKRKFIDSVWPLVEKANRETLAHGQISRELITIANPSKPFLRSGKNTIQRASTIQLYAEEIDILYAGAETKPYLLMVPFDVSSEESLRASILQIFKSLGGKAELEPDMDFFTISIDSLQVLNALRMLQASLRLESSVLSTLFIYRNPTPRRLAQYILRTTTGNGVERDKKEDDYDISVARALYEKYAKDLIPGQQEKQRKDRGLVWELEHTRKVEYLHADLSKDKLGLLDNMYGTLLKEAHRIIHNAWPVNFNITAETFELHLRGVRNLADFATEAEQVAVVFISSIGTVHYWDPSRGSVPEERMEDWSLPSNSYGLSKMAGSLILDDAAAVGDFSAASIRIGQIAGPAAEIGMWNKREWFPSIIASSLYMGILPRDLGSNNRIDWVPVEYVARLVLDVSTHLRHATTWGEIAPFVQQYYGSRIKHLVSWREWVDRLENSISSTYEKEIDANPGLKLIETYRGMALGAAPVVLDLQRTNDRATAMAEAPMISTQLMAQWFRQWNF
ncbi:hypothetical protein F5Y12DRAFT_717757 [Xylaria sp. FL1777]|nr:hypothetical protein F5Y12DRAFT_717757 [Xylaria sp. FL1777]